MPTNDQILEIAEYFLTQWEKTTDKLFISTRDMVSEKVPIKDLYDVLDLLIKRGCLPDGKSIGLMASTLFTSEKVIIP